MLPIEASPVAEAKSMVREVLWLIKFMCEWNRASLDTLIEESLQSLTHTLSIDTVCTEVLDVMDMIASSQKGISRMYAKHTSDILKHLVSRGAAERVSLFNLCRAC